MNIKLNAQEVNQAVLEFLQKRFNTEIKLNSLVIKSPRLEEGYHAVVDITLVEKSMFEDLIEKGKNIADDIVAKFTGEEEPDNTEEEVKEINEKADALLSGSTADAVKEILNPDEPLEPEPEEEVEDVKLNNILKQIKG